MERKSCGVQVLWSASPVECKSCGAQDMGISASNISLPVKRKGNVSASNISLPVKRKGNVSASNISPPVKREGNVRASNDLIAREEKG